jgi:hypothetical protein
LIGWSAAEGTFAPLPALYVLAVAAGLALGLRRWFDAVPVKVLLLFLAYVALLFGPVLAGGAVLLPVDTLRYHVPYELLAPADPPAVPLQRDLVHQIAPWALEVKRAVLAGRWPLWNPHQGAGTPLMADPQSQPFQPLVALAYPFSIWTAAGISAALKVLCALVFTFLLLRRQGLGEPASAAGATAYGLGGFVILWVGWPIATCAALLPAALYAVTRCDDRGGRRDYALLALATAALLLGGHPETLIYCLALVALFLLDRFRLRWRHPGIPAIVGEPHQPGDPGHGGSSRERPGGRWAFLVRSALALAVAGALAAPVLLPTREFLPTTQRSAVISAVLSPLPVAQLGHDLLQPGTRSLWLRHAIHRLVPVAAPNAFGDQRFVYWGENNYIQDTAEFVGSPTLACALLGLGTLLPGARRRFPQERLAALVLLGSLALLAQPPGFDRLAVKLPLVGPTAVHKHQRIQVLIALALCYLAACQIERWRRGELRRRWIFGAFAAAAALIGCCYLGNGNPDRPGDPWDWRIDSLRLQLAALAAALLLLLLGRVRLSTPLARLAPLRRLAPWGFGAAAAAELLAFYAGANPPNPARLAFPMLPPVRFLAAHLGDDRLVGAATALPANFAGVHALSDVRVDNPSEPRGYARATGAFDRGTLEPVFTHLPHAFYDFLGVRYVVSRAGAELPFRLAFADPSGWVWERPRALPRLFLPERVQIERAGNWEDWLLANPDFSFRALAEPTDEVYRRWRAGAPGASTLAPGRAEAERLPARASLAEMRLLASSVYQDGGWRILAGGRPLRAVRVNGTFAGAWMPAGAWDVELLYRPAALVWGCLLAALGAAAGAACWLPPPRPPAPRSRRRTGAGAVLS